MKTLAFTKSYGKRVVLSLPELKLPRGEITAIIGPNGSGKSTLAKVLAGIERADNNRSILLGVSVGYLPQKSFPFRMSTEKNILQNGNDPVRAQALMKELGIALGLILLSLSLLVNIILSVMQGRLSR